MEFTKSQTDAINTMGKDLLVSASAGSGKTSVLTERIVGRIKLGEDLENFLVVTFTNSAAEDLKRKLQSKLGELIKNNPKDKRLKNQLYKLPCASIGTIHSFCLRIIRENFSLLELPSKINVGEESLFHSMQNECIEDLITELCESDDESIALLLDNFATYKSDKGLVDVILALYSTIRAFPFYLKWLDSTLEALREEKESFLNKGFFSTPGGKILKPDLIRKLNYALENAVYGAQLCVAEGSDKNEAVFNELQEKIADLKSAAEKSYEDFCAETVNFKYRNLSKASEEAKDVKKAVVESVSTLAKSYVVAPAVISDEYDESIKVLSALIYVIKLFDASFTKKKRERAMIDFCDIEQLFLSLLLKEAPDGGYIKTDLCRSLTKTVGEIFVDEYQDVSPLQDMIFKVISKGNNRFMVGDVKQSIYRFRNAYPDIFIGYKESFADLEEAKDKARILLRENFRCSKSIVGFVNLLFTQIYTKATADSDYAGEELIYGRGSGSDLPVKVKVFTDAKEDETYAEAHFIASEIKNLINENKDDGPPIRYGDIAVLMRSLSNQKVYAEVFSEYGIPCLCARSTEKLFERPEVLLVISALRVIDNPTDDLSLAALLRSPVYGFTAQELAAICRSGHSTLYKGVKNYSERGKLLKRGRYTLKRLEKKHFKKPSHLTAVNPNSNELSKKCRDFLGSLESYRSSALLLPSHKLIWLFYQKSGIFSYRPKGTQEEHQGNLLKFYQWAKEAEGGAFKGVSAFVEHLNQMTENDQSPEATDAVSDDAVRFMTVHASKGLEFPVCFVAELGKQINNKHKNASVSVDRDGGLAFKLAHQKEASIKSTLRRDCFILKETRDLIAEELRVLYVAFTRARERLYVSGTVNGDISDLEKHNVYNPNSYLSTFFSVIREIESPHFELDVTSLAECCGEEATESKAEETEKTEKTEKAEDEVKIKETVSEDVSESVSKVAESSNETEDAADTLVLPEDIKLEAITEAKISVSMIRQDENGLFTVAEQARGEIKRPAFAFESTELTAADKGTATHLFMQFASFEQAEKNGISVEADRLLAKGFITKEQREMLNEKQISAFLCSALYGRICSSPRVFREKRFTTELNSALFSGGNSGILIQGVVDCFFENPDGSYTLIDYKTDRVKENEEQKLIDRHRTQLSFYAEAIEKLTGRPVSEIFIYSLHLGKEIKCERLKFEE